jgi:hypothetical protein
MQKVSGIKEVRLSLVTEKTGTKPDTLLIVALGVEKTGEWRSAELVPYSYVVPPADGLWEFDFSLIDRSSTPTDVITPIFAIHAWRDFPVDTLKGITVHGKHNSLKKEISASFFDNSMKLLASYPSRILEGATDPWLMAGGGERGEEVPFPMIPGEDPFPWLWGDDPFPW